MTIGIVRVLACISRVAAVPTATITSTLPRATARRRSGQGARLACRHRVSTRRFWPSTQPRSRSPREIALLSLGRWVRKRLRNYIANSARGFVDCCAGLAHHRGRGRGSPGQKNFAAPHSITSAPTRGRHRSHWPRGTSQVYRLSTAAPRPFSKATDDDTLARGERKAPPRGRREFNRRNGGSLYSCSRDTIASPASSAPASAGAAIR